MLFQLFDFFFRGVLKYQTNIEAHPPGCVTANQSSWDPQAKEVDKGDNEDRPCREEAYFQGHYPQVCLLSSSLYLIVAISWSAIMCLHVVVKQYIRNTKPSVLAGFIGTDLRRWSEWVRVNGLGLAAREKVAFTSSLVICFCRLGFGCRVLFVFTSLSVCSATSGAATL